MSAEPGEVPRLIFDEPGESALVRISRQASGVQMTINSFAAAYHDAVLRGAGDKWMLALRSYLELVEVSQPSLARRSDGPSQNGEGT